MINALPLRDYQQQAIDAIETALAGGDRPTGKGKVNRVGVVMATGLGKTVIFAHLCLAHTGSRILVLVHRDELAQQAKAKIHSVAPHLRVGIVMGSRNEVNADIIVASVQTIGPSAARMINGTMKLRKERVDDIRGVGMIIVDEAHHAAANTWRMALLYFGAYNGVPTIGFTATMSREDNRGLGEIWEEVVFKRDTLWGIQNGHLSDVRGIRVQVPNLDLAGVKIRAGDLQQEQVAQEMLDANTGEAIAKAVTEFVPDRRGPVFAPNVATAHDFADALNEVKQPAEVVIGTTPIGERREIYERLRTGETRWLANAMVLTEGWDAPWADCAVVARPTRSAGLYQQMIGRVLRPWQAGGKRDAIVLDVVGTSTKHHLASLIDLSPDRPVRERQSILEAWDEEADWIDVSLDDEGFPTEHRRVEKVIGTEVDLLAGGSPSPWLQTRAGTWFIPAGELLFFIWPEIEDGAHNGLVTVGVTARDRFERSTPLRQGLPFESGMTWAEALAAEHRKPPTQKWRDSEPSQKMIRDAHVSFSGLGGANQGELYDYVSIEAATKRLDR